MLLFCKIPARDSMHFGKNAEIGAMAILPMRIYDLDGVARCFIISLIFVGVEMIFKIIVVTIDITSNAMHLRLRR